jgi:MFS family permease
MPLSFRLRMSPIWRHRDFRRLWIGETISEIGSSLSGFALPIVAAVTLGATAGQMGVIRGLSTIPTLVIGLVAGAWVDRMSRQRLLIAINLAAAVVIASVPVAYALDALSITHLYVLSLAFGALFPFWLPAWHAFLPAVVDADQLVEANSKLMLTFSATGITGPGLGGALLLVLSAPFLLMVDAASFLVTAAFVAGVRTRQPEHIERDERPPLRAQIIEGLRVTFIDPMQRALTVPRLILNALDSLMLTVVVLYILGPVGLTESLMGLAFALSSVGFVAGSLIAPRVERRLNVGGMITLGLFLVAASPYTMVVADDSLPSWVNVLFFAVPGFIGGTGGIIQHVGLMSLRQAITPARLLGRVTASAAVIGDVMWLAGAAAGGILGETVGLRPAVVVAAVGYALPFLYVWLSPLRHATRVAATADRTDEAPAEPESVT